MPAPCGVSPVRDVIEFSLAAWITLAVIAGVFVSLAATRLAPDVVLVIALTVLLVSGVIDPATAMSAAANPAVATIAVLYVVVAGLRDTDAMVGLTQRWLGRPSGLASAQLRLMLPVSGASMFMNNTPLVAAMLPTVSEWARKIGLSPSALLMPLSYAAILGGLCTLVGTSTNLVVAGLLDAEVAAGRVARGYDFFTLLPVGLAALAAGTAWVLFASPRLLPTRQSPVRDPGDPRAYTIEMQVLPGNSIDGCSIEEAGLRHLPGCFLAEVERGDDMFIAVGPQFRLQGGDRLVFVGVVEAILDLQRIPGLAPATEQMFKLDGPRNGRVLVEAVVSDRSPMVGQSIREGRFRSRYNAVVIAVARGGSRLYQRLGDVVLREGDTLLLEARPSFVDQHRNSRDFYLVSGIPDSHPRRHERAGVALLILAAMIVAATLFEQLGFFRERDFGILHAALPAALLMVATGCCSVDSARRSVDWSVLIVIACAMGLGKAVEMTGLSAVAAAFFTGDGAEMHPVLALATIYFATMLATELLSNSAAAVLMFPVAVSAASMLGLDPMPFVVAMTIAASCGFATPLGYQTHLMVYGPGGYRYADFLRMGLPLNLIVGFVTILIAPRVWPF